MLRSRSGWAIALVLAATQASVAPAAAAGGVAASYVTPSTGAEASKRSEYGVALALSGEYRQAEDVFISVLAASPRDPRALTNLGNLHALQGDLAVALAFYEKAQRGAPSDAGIVLDRATTLMLMGDRERAEAEAARGMELAGGEAQAARLLGLPDASPDPTERGSNKAMLSPQELRAMLQAASRRVPSDKVAPADSLRWDPKAKRPSSSWRSAGPRGSDGSELALALYWKK